MLLIFDWDGTLCDSTQTIVKSMQVAARACELPVLEPLQIEHIIGLGLSEAIHQLYPKATAEKVQQVRDAYSAAFVELDRKKPAALFDQALEVLQELRQRGYLLAVATGKSRRGLDRVLASLDMTGYFDSSRCADETQSKPHPQMLEELLAEFALDASQATMIGDTSYDLGMAQALGMPRIGVSYGVHDVENLQTFHPEQVIDHLSELLLLFPPLAKTAGI